MKRFLILLMLAVLIYSVAVADNARDNLEIARSLANFMEDHYSVTILLGEECDQVSTEGFVLGDTPFGRSPLQNLLGMADYEAEMKTIDDAFSVYPLGFFQKFVCDESPLGLRILLADQIIIDWDSHIAGVTTIQDGYYNIFLGAGAFYSLNIHHEIWHAMEKRITAEYPDAFSDWAALNPEGFEYDGSYGSMDPWLQVQDGDEYFVRGYSRINEREDRATVIEAVFSQDSEWWAEHPFIQAKLDMMLKAAELVFGNVYGDE